MSLGDGISAIVGSIVIGSIIMPDITRFLRSSRGALMTSGTSDLIAQPFVMWAAAVAALALGTNDIIGIILTLGCKHIRHVVQLLLIDLHLRNNQTKHRELVFMLFAHTDYSLQFYLGSQNPRVKIAQ
tara:strand:- start:190 stop:573 length:384 start_codon:yes stop_codon:yes gene_type:complete